MRNVDLYVRFGQRVTMEGGEIIADFVGRSPTGIEDLYLPRNRPGSYFVAVANCSDAEANYFIAIAFL